MKHNGTRLVKILLFYSLIMSFSCATCMSTLGFCIIILYYKACTKYFPVLLCTTKLAQSTSQYYFVLQSLHKVLPSTTLYYKACTKYFPVQSATPATQNDMTTCLETFEKEMFCSFPHRHGINDATTTRRRPDDATPTRRRRDEPLEANKGPAPRPTDYKREPFATHSGKTR